MSFVATAVIKGTPQPISASYIQNASVVDQYKTLLSNIRLARSGQIAKIKVKMDEIQSLIDSKEALVQQFMTAAFQMYPEFKGQDLSVVLPTLSSDHPLKALYNRYSQSWADVENSINQKLMELDNLQDQEANLEQQESQTLDSYLDFTKQAQTVVPSPDELVAGLQSVEIIPVSREADLKAMIPAIELLSPQAAADVTLQLAASGQPGIDLAMSQQPPVANAPARKPIPPMAKVGIGLAALYVLFGGKK